jgi:hypothetical protein
MPTARFARQHQQRRCQVRAGRREEIADLSDDRCHARRQRRVHLSPGAQIAQLPALQLAGRM